MSKASDIKEFPYGEIQSQTIENTQNIALIQQNLASLQASVGNLANTVETYIKSNEASKKPNWSQWIAFGSLLIALFSGGWMIINLKITTEINPMNARIAQEATLVEGLAKYDTQEREDISRLITQAQTSMDDRNQLNKRVDALTDKANENTKALAAEVAIRSSHETETETQFDADGQLRNVQFAEQQRINHILWSQHKKTLGDYPNGPYFFPNIANRDGKRSNEAGGGIP